MPDPRGWAPDEIYPRQVLKGMETWFSNGWHYTYPAFHFYLLGLLYLPILKLHSLGVITTDLHPTLLMAGRALTLGMSVVSLIFIYRCAKFLFGPRAALVAGFLIAMTPQFIYYSKTVNLDVPCLMWYMISLFFYLRILFEGHQLRDYLGLAVFAACAVCTKDQAVGMYLTLPPLLVLSRILQEREQTGVWPNPFRIIFSKEVGVAALTSVALFVIFNNFVFNWKGFLGHLDIIMGEESRSHYYMFDTSLHGRWLLLDQTIWNICFVLGIPALLLCVVGVVDDLRRDGWMRSSVVWLLLSAPVFYVMIISPIRYGVDRYFLPIACILAFYGGAAAIRLLDRSRGWKRTFTVGVISSILAWSFVRGTSVNALMLEDTRYDAEIWMHQHIPAHDVVYVIGRDYYLPRRGSFRYKGVPPKLAALGIINNEYLVVNGTDTERYSADSRETQFFARLRNGTTKCELRFSHQAHPRLNVLAPRFDATNLAKINPRIEIYYCRADAD